MRSDFSFKHYLYTTSVQLRYYGVCNEGIPWSISVGKKFPTETVLIFAEMFTEIGLSFHGNGTFVIKKFRGKGASCTPRALTK